MKTPAENKTIVLEAFDALFKLQQISK